MEKKERRSSILKPQQPPSADTGEVSTTLTAAIKRRVSFHHIRTVQEYDAEHTNIMHSPHVEPVKLCDTTSSDDMSSKQASGMESKGADVTDRFSSTIENFAPVTTSTPLPRMGGLKNLQDYSMLGDGDTHGDAECHNSLYSGTRGKEANAALDYIPEKESEWNENLNVESMEISGSDEPSPPTSEISRKLFRRSTVMRPFMSNPNQQTTLIDETLVSNPTQMIFKSLGNRGRRSSVANETLKAPLCSVDMDISSGNTTDDDHDVDGKVDNDDDDNGDVDMDKHLSGLVPEEPRNASKFQQLQTSAVADVVTGSSVEANVETLPVSAEEGTENQASVNDETSVIAMSEDAEVSNGGENTKSTLMPESTQKFDISSYVEPPLDEEKSLQETITPQQNLTCDMSTKFDRSMSVAVQPVENTANELSSQLSRQHISEEFIASTRKTTLGSPAVLPKKKIRLLSPKVTLPPKTSSLLFGSPRVGAKKIVSSPLVRSSEERNPSSTPENTASSDKSTEEVLNEIKNRSRRRLNQSGVFTLAELIATDAESVPMLYDIPMPEPLFHTDELYSQLSTAETCDVDTAVEPTYVESSSLSSRRSEIFTAALGHNESSFLTSRVDAVGFDINVRTVPCLRLKRNDEPQIVELKQLLTGNLQKRILEVNSKFKGLIDEQLPKCDDHKIAECIRTLNPRKLPKKEASWFDACYLMAQREWFMFRTALARVTDEELDELILKAEPEYESKKQLAQSANDYQQNYDEMMQRYNQLKMIDEAVTNEAQNLAKYEELQKKFRANRLEIERLKLEVAKKRTARLEALVKEYEEAKAELATYKLRKAARRAEFLRKYDEEMAPYRDLFK